MNRPAEWTIYESPQGPLTVSGGSSGVGHVYFPGQSPHLDEAARRPMGEVAGQLDEYFAGKRKAFEIALDLGGSPLQKLVWARLLQIPYGTTISYGELAEGIEESEFPAGLEPYRRAQAGPVGARGLRRGAAQAQPQAGSAGADLSSLSSPLV